MITGQTIPSKAPSPATTTLPAQQDVCRKYETDTIADKINQMPEQNFIQRKCVHCEEEEKVQRKPLLSFIQRKEATGTREVSSNVNDQLQSSKGNGNSLEPGVKNFMENRFGTGFNEVKVHTNREAIQMNRDLNGKAFTVGNDIYFNEGQYNPNSGEGKKLLAHELTHTIQQGSNVSGRLIQKNGNPPAAAVAPAAPVYGAACSVGASNPCQYSRCDGKHGVISGDFRKALDYVIAAYGALGAATLSDRTIQALDWYFNDHSPSTVSTVRHRMLCIALCLLDAYGHDQYGCHPEHSAIAYVCVGNTPICTDAVTKICLTDTYFKKSSRVRAESLIHECGHRIGLSLGGKDFDIYDFTWHFMSLDTREALMNSDSFALFAAAITEGVRTTLIPQLGFSGGLASRAGTWYGRLYGGVEFQHPVLGIFNPTIGASVTLIGDPQSESSRPTVSVPTFTLALLAGFKLTDPRPGEGGGGYASFWGGPTLNLGGGSVKAGAEAGMGIGYRWRWLDISLNAGYNYDPTHSAGSEHVFTIGPSISFSPEFFQIPGTH
jgi:Domain of unknown function (DUF4157)